MPQKKDPYRQKLVSLNPGIHIYLVGGAVRDSLLNIKTNDRDWVIVGATTEQMKSAGFHSVGKDFPVFIHPESGEEYALARQERKINRGHQGFEFHTAENVSLSDDLTRRDFTINAMAMDDENNLIDPHNGLKDLNNRVIRHISGAFNEDPLRVLRAARFAARFFSQGFTLADETLNCLKEMSASGELETLTAERVWLETEKGLKTDSPHIYFQVLKDIGALKQLFPEIDALFGVPQPANYHPEIDTGIHSIMALKAAARLSKEPIVRFSALLHDLGKARTPKEAWPSHRQHEELGIEPIQKLCKRLKTPKAFMELALKTSRFHTLCHRCLTLSAEEILALFEKLDSFRNPLTLEYFLLACEADARGRKGLETKDYPQADFLRRLFSLVKPVKAEPFIQQGFSGKIIGEKIAAQRRKLIADQIRNN